MAVDTAWTGAGADELAAFHHDFELTGVLGEGAAARVLAARERSSGRAVALKFLVLHDSEMEERFMREGRLMEQLRHPCVVAVHETRRLGGVPFLVTEHCAGGTLRAHVTKAGKLAPAEATRFALDILAGLQACHAMGIVHRDLKPANILLTAEREAKIADLGVAKLWGAAEELTQDGFILGTPAYMAPETLRGDAAGVAADLYSVGVMLFEMLAGRLPHQAATLVDLMKAHRDNAFPPCAGLPAHVPEGLKQVCERLLAPRPADRPATAEDARMRLRRVARMNGWPLIGEGGRAGEVTTPASGWRSSSSNALGAFHAAVTEAGTTIGRDGIAAARASGIHRRDVSGVAKRDSSGVSKRDCVPKRDPSGTGRRDPLAVSSRPTGRSAAAAPGARATGRLTALPSMRSFRARSGQVLVPTVRASMIRAMGGLGVRAILWLSVLIAVSASAVVWATAG